MLKSKICLPDINVWIALTWDRHIHHPMAREWFFSSERNSTAFCRITQMGFLRLISNPKVMGEDTVSQREAWKIYERLSRDHRVFFAPERPEVEGVWKRHSLSAFAGKNLWTDAYLAAFAGVRSWRLVSFDKGFRRRKTTGFELTILA